MFFITLCSNVIFILTVSERPFYSLSLNVTIIMSPCHGSPVSKPVFLPIMFVVKSIVFTMSKQPFYPLSPNITINISLLIICVLTYYVHSSCLITQNTSLVKLQNIYHCLCISGIARSLSLSPNVTLDMSQYQGSPVSNPLFLVKSTMFTVSKQPSIHCPLM